MSKKKVASKKIKHEKKVLVPAPAPVDDVAAAGAASDHPREEGDKAPVAVKREDLHPVAIDSLLEDHGGAAQLWQAPFPATGPVLVHFNTDIPGIGTSGSVAVIPAEIAQHHHRHLSTPVVLPADEG